VPHLWQLTVVDSEKKQVRQALMWCLSLWAVGIIFWNYL
jgi:hypothetical protein